MTERSFVVGRNWSLAQRRGRGALKRPRQKRVSQSVSQSVLLSSVAPYLSPEKNWRPRRGAVGLDILELRVDMYRDVKKGW